MKFFSFSASKAGLQQKDVLEVLELTNISSHLMLEKGNGMSKNFNIYSVNLFVIPYFWIGSLSEACCTEVLREFLYIFLPIPTRNCCTQSYRGIAAYTVCTVQYTVCGFPAYTLRMQIFCRELKLIHHFRAKNLFRR